MPDTPMTAEQIAASTLAYDTNFAIVESVTGNQVEFSFDLDRARWPWLSLPPRHPVLIEKYQYFTSITAGWATGLFAPSTYSALTGFKWTCPEVSTDCGYATRAVCVNRETSEGVSIDIDVFDENDRYIVQMECIGAEFGDRDFKSWRTSAKKKALELAGSVSVEYAPAEKVGVGAAGISLISEVDGTDGMPAVTALVTSSNGFHPAHPYLTGSGDHVNVAHFFDCGLQMANLILEPEATLQCTGGNASFMRFIELDVPFRIALLEKESGDGIHRLSFQLSQLDRICTVMQFSLKEGS